MCLLFTDNTDSRFEVRGLRFKQQLFLLPRTTRWIASFRLTVPSLQDGYYVRLRSSGIPDPSGIADPSGRVWAALMAARAFAKGPAAAIVDDCDECVRRSWGMWCEYHSGARLDGGFSGVCGVGLGRYVCRCNEALKCLQPYLLLRTALQSELRCCEKRRLSW
jgi:hypothetical protein